MDHEISDAMLTALALAADPAAPVDDDAVPLSFDDAACDWLLPAWYMPPVAASGTTFRRRVVIGVLVGSAIVVNGAGLCVTYGLPEIAW